MPTTITPVDVTPAFTSAQYDTVDITSHVGADSGNVVGAILRVVNTNVGGTESGFDLRKPGSTDDYSAKNIEDDAQSWPFVGVDANDQFEVYRGADDYELWLLAYVTAAEGASFTNGIDKTPATEDSFQQIDISADTGADTATLAFFKVVNHVGVGGTVNFAFRVNGSTDTFFSQQFSDEIAWDACAVDGSEVLEFGWSTDGPDIDLLLVGYLTANVTWQTNASDHATATTGSYVSTDLSATIPSGNDGALVRFPEPGGGFGVSNQSEQDGDVRRTGSTDDNSGRVMHPRAPIAFVPLDSGRTIEQFISATDMDLKLLGWTQTPAGGTPVSQSSEKHLESLATASVPVAKSWEALAEASQQNVKPLEWTGATAVSRSTEKPLEYLGRVARSLDLSLESVQTLTATSEKPTESVQPVSATKLLPLEHVVAFAATREKPLEALQGVFPTSEKHVEYLLGVSTTKLTPYEIVRAFGVSRPMYLESVTEVSATKLTALETVRALSDANVKPLEWTSALASVSRSVEKPLEWLAEVSRTTGVPLEALQTVTASGVLEIEYLRGGFSKSRTVPLEYLLSLSREEQVFLAWQQGGTVALDLTAPFRLAVDDPNRQLDVDDPNRTLEAEGG